MKGVNDLEMIAPFQWNCHDKGILNTLARRRVQNFSELTYLMEKYCAMESMWKEQQFYIEPVHTEQPREV